MALQINNNEAKTIIDLIIKTVKQEKEQEYINKYNIIIEKLKNNNYWFNSSELYFMRICLTFRDHMKLKNKILRHEPKKIKLKIKPEIKVGNYYFVESQYRFKPHTLYKIIKETNCYIHCQEMKYFICDFRYNREGKISHYHYEDNIYNKNSWKIVKISKEKVKYNIKNIWTINKLKKYDLYKLVEYND
jgi:hypothetical protein